METAVTTKDSTLREGLDTPGVSFSMEQRAEILRLLAALGVSEAEIVAPARVAQDLEFAVVAAELGCGIRTSGLVYANRESWLEELGRCRGVLDRVDLIMPLSPRRAPEQPEDKLRALEAVLPECRFDDIEVGVGFPHSTQVSPEFLCEMCECAAGLGASRLTIYDTNGSAQPFGVRSLITKLAGRIEAPLHFHGHNDLGLATANSLAAILGGARGVDATINGLGDRAGNASLEQFALASHLAGITTGIDLRELRAAAVLVSRASGVPVSKLAPVVGDFVFDHKSPAHLPTPDEFEAFDPDLVGATRRLS